MLGENYVTAIQYPFLAGYWKFTKVIMTHADTAESFCVIIGSTTISEVQTF
jgi:hypothetical protein